MQLDSLHAQHAQPDHTASMEPLLPVRMVFIAQLAPNLLFSILVLLGRSTTKPTSRLKLDAPLVCPDITAEIQD